MFPPLKMMAGVQDKKNNPVQAMYLSGTVILKLGAPLYTSSMGFNISFFFFFKNGRKFYDQMFEEHKIKHRMEWVFYFSELVKIFTMLI